jgi:hypothetical protein
MTIEFTWVKTGPISRPFYFSERSVCIFWINILYVRDIYVFSSTTELLPDDYLGSRRFMRHQLVGAEERHRLGGMFAQSTRLLKRCSDWGLTQNVFPFIDGFPLLFTIIAIIFFYAAIRRSTNRKSQFSDEDLRKHDLMTLFFVINKRRMA